jgi:UDP-N-acetylglucosamine--N-acetylmuramyl-(pentapeptide) pyrophosphoryl-undecaprenol N-acetylglucosamine transferase
VFGGSRGSVPINTLVCEALPYLDQENIKIVHQTGEADYDRVKTLYANHQFPAEVRQYIEDMPSYFATTDLIISRSGASTVAEITASGRPSILIPLPHATDDHQRKNAEALSVRGAAVMLDQHGASGETLAKMIQSLAKERRQLVEMASQSKRLSRPNSTREIVKLMAELSSKDPFSREKDLL